MVFATDCFSLVCDWLVWSRLACCVVGISTLRSSVFSVASWVLVISSSFACVMISQVSVSYCFRRNRLVFRLLMGHDCSVDCCFHDVMVCYLIIFVFWSSFAVSFSGFAGRWPLRGFTLHGSYLNPSRISRWYISQYLVRNKYKEASRRTCYSLLAIWMMLVTICQGICVFFYPSYVRGCVSPSCGRPGFDSPQGRTI